MICAILGLGRIGSLFEKDVLREKPASHAGAIDAFRHCKLSYGCDKNVARCREFARDWKVQTFADAKQMLQHPIDCLVIATPTDQHCKHFLLALKKNIPIVILEKPIARNWSDISAMRREWKRSKSHVIVNHERRFAKNYCDLKKAIEEQRWGNLLGVYGWVSGAIKHNPLDVLYHDGTHMVDAVRFLLKNPACDDGERNDGEMKKEETNFPLLKVQYIDHMKSDFLNTLKISACISTEKNDSSKRQIPFFFDISCGKEYLQFELHFHFSHGLVRLGNGLYEEYNSVQSPYYKDFFSLSCNKRRSKQSTYCFANMIKHAHDLFAGRAKKSLSSFDDGYAVVKFFRDVERKMVDNKR